MLDHELAIWSDIVQKNGRAMLRTMKELCEFFATRCEDRDTLDKLVTTIGDRGSWKSSRTLFNQIRAKNLKAERRQDILAQTQYAFEEVCAKTLYNLTHEPAPFDPDSPYWIVPLALKLAKKLGATEHQIIEIVAGRSV